MPFEPATTAAATIKLLLIPAGGGKPAAIAVSGDGGVDLGAVGRAVGLEPSSVRLNGYFLSRGADLVSGLTWASLLSFFSARGLPSGVSGGDPIAVQGKPAAVSDHLSFKRKCCIENESPLKRSRVAHNDSAFLGSGDGQLNDYGNLCTKRGLRLEDNNPAKKRKLVGCDLGSLNEASKLPPVAKTIFSYNCISGRGKRPREDEMVSALSCNESDNAILLK
ncbi:uncharacterized protein [Typha latifolia]|uniref:uncharacterized protein n=1 Tax=Typha latifolia TaxID=4733 RepID=UPI003C2C9CDC